MLLSIVCSKGHTTERSKRQSMGRKFHLIASQPPSTHEDCKDAEHDSANEEHATYHHTSDTASSPIVVVVVVATITVLQQLTPCGTRV